MSGPKDFPHPFGDIAKKYREVRRRLPKEVSVIAVNHFKKNFQRQGYYTTGGRKRWQKLKGKRRGAILSRSGRLKRSLRAAPTYDLARVVTNLPYAKAHNEGVKKTVRIHSFTRNRYGSKKVGRGTYSIKTRKENMRTVKFKTGSGRVRSHSRSMNLPARPFMNTDPLLVRAIERHYYMSLRNLWD